MDMKANGKLVKSQRLDKLVNYYISIRDEIKELETRHKVELEPLIEMRERLTYELLMALDAAGTEMARTKAGTVSASVHDTAVCIDPNAFIDFVRQNDMYELMDRRANGTACKAFAKEHGELPPGVKVNSKRSVSVRSP